MMTIYAKNEYTYIYSNIKVINMLFQHDDYLR